MNYYLKNINMGSGFKGSFQFRILHSLDSGEEQLRVFFVVT